MAALCLLVLAAGAVWGSHATEAPPPRPPDDIIPVLTLNGTVPIQYYYVDDSNRGKGTHYKFSSDDIIDLLGQAEAFVAKALAVPPPPPPSSIARSHMTWSSQLTDIWLCHALNNHSLSDKSVVVFGSTSPWYESMAIAMGASHVTVVEYNRLTYDHPAISTMFLSDLQKTPQFDIALSLSSFDHDGLGRYGDPIDPTADLVAMETVSSVLKEGGLLFLTVPLGPDVVVWNLHRRYGNARLPLLLRGWEEVERVGWEGRLVEEEAAVTSTYEPVFVLRKPSKAGESPHTN